MRALSAWLAGVCLLTVASLGSREKKQLVSLLRAFIPSDQGPALRIYYLREALSQNTIILGVSASTYRFWRDADLQFIIPAIEGLVQVNEQTNPGDLGLNPNTVVVNFL